MMHVLTAFGTRPEAIKLLPVVAELRNRPGLRCTICVTGQHQELLDEALDLFEVQPDHDLAVMRPDQSPVDVAAAVLTGFDGIVRDEAPDWVLVQGDTTTTMAAALVAFHRRVRVAHLEAGLRTGNLQAPFPEELNRRIVTIATDLHLAATTWAAKNLEREGVSADSIVVTGNTVVDALLDIAARPVELAGTPLEALDPERRLVLVTAHRRESFGTPLDGVFAAVAELARSRPEVDVLVPVHPNPRVGAAARAQLGALDNVVLSPPLPYSLLVHALARSFLVLTDSGGIQEEAPTFGVPVLVLREVTERVEALEAGTAVLVGTDPDRILGTACELLDEPAAHAAMATAANPFGDGRARVRVADALLARA